MSSLVIIRYKDMTDPIKLIKLYHNWSYWTFTYLPIPQVSNKKDDRCNKAPLHMT
jgi:hypothetical protein